MSTAIARRRPAESLVEGHEKLLDRAAAKLKCAPIDVFFRAHSLRYRDSIVNCRDPELAKGFISKKSAQNYEDYMQSKETHKKSGLPDESAEPKAFLPQCVEEFCLDIMTGRDPSKNPTILSAA